MKIFIADLTTICNLDDLIIKLPQSDVEKYKSFKREIRAQQFLMAHYVKNQFDSEFKYTSIAHKDNFVIVAASNMPIGVDIEDASKNRDFKTMSEFMNFSNVKNADDFYRAFTEYEARYKMPTPDCGRTRFYTIGNYMICVVSNEQNIEPVWTNLIPEQIQ